MTVGELRSVHELHRNNLFLKEAFIVQTEFNHKLYHSANFAVKLKGIYWIVAVKSTEMICMTSFKFRQENQERAINAGLLI